jgi:hypothetical protein
MLQRQFVRMKPVLCLLDRYPMSFMLASVVLLLMGSRHILTFSKGATNSGKGEKSATASRSPKYKLVAQVLLSSMPLIAIVCLQSYQIWANVSLCQAEIDGNHRKTAGNQVLPDLFHTSISELQRGLEDGQYTSVHLVEAYLARINEVNTVLHAVMEIAPQEILLEQAKQLDEERTAKGKRTSLHGIPILVKVCMLHWKRNTLHMLT